VPSPGTDPRPAWQTPATGKLTLVSHHLCPYVQRAAIALAEKRIAFERIYVDLADKPAWFRALSPLGKVPLLQVGDVALFESAAILEYLEETRPHPLHPEDALTRARHRAWIEFGSSMLNDIARLYNAPDRDVFEAARESLREKFGRLEAELEQRPADGPDAGQWFAGARFTLVDAVFGPVFRYFDVFDRIGDFGILGGFRTLATWREELARRPSVRDAVGADYPERLRMFLERKQSHLGRLTVAHWKAQVA